MKKILLSAILTFCILPVFAQDAECLHNGFADPAPEYRPSVWWHWMYGNVTEDGIRKDLKWLDSVGITGVHLFDAGLSTPILVKPRVKYMDERWGRAVATAVDLADSLGMSFTVAASPGWSTTGGPWVSKDDAQKKLVWRDTLVAGGRRLKLDLPKNYLYAGPYQDIIAFPSQPDRYSWYRDVCVLAARVKVSKSQPVFDSARIAVSGSDNGAEMLRDGFFDGYVEVGPDADGDSWVAWEFDSPVTVRSLMVADRAGNDFAFEASEDGKTWRVVEERIQTGYTSVRWVKYTIGLVDVPATTARFVRVRALSKNRPIRPSEVVFYPVEKVNQVISRAGYTPSSLVSDKYSTPPTEYAIDPRDVIDVTAFVKDGKLDWKAPRGTWKIYRFGMNLLGIENGPETPEATGLEIDKYDADVVRRYFETYLGKIAAVSGKKLGEDIGSIVIDSYESGKSTWTPSIETEFKSRRGYDLRTWLPVLAGDIVGSSLESDRFLYDWRATLSELMEQNHYQQVADILKPYGMKYFSEAHEQATAFLGDGMACKSRADYPMGAAWVTGGIHTIRLDHAADLRESSSVAHIYGGNICAAESMSANGSPGNGVPGYSVAPYRMKAVADAAMAEGLNKFVIHSTVHQPYDSLFPGVGLGMFGQWFNRHDTWASEAGPWIDYLARSSYMLTQGRWVADFAVFYGEDHNATAVYAKRSPDVPEGYNFDLVNADILKNVLSAKDGKLRSESGMEYSVLVIDSDVRVMSLETLKRLREIADAGVVICGPKPVLKGGKAGSDREYRSVADDVWSRPNVVSDPIEAARLAGLVPDVEGLGGRLKYVHRTLPEGEIYWIANSNESGADIELSLRASGYKPMVWHADTGLVEECGFAVEGERTTVRLSMVEDDALFVVMTGRTDVSELTLPKRTVSEIEIKGPWKVSFQQGRGAPESITMKDLRGLEEHQDNGVRFFSGTAVYTCSFNLDAVPEGELRIDLPEVHHMARVIVNGVDCGLLWKEPYCTADVRQALRQGENKLEIRVVNTWRNRLIGDASKPQDQRITYTTKQFASPTELPPPSGLDGPVTIVVIR